MSKVLICLFLLQPLLSLTSPMPMPTQSTTNNNKHAIAKRFVLHSQHWEKCRLTWAFRDPFGLLPSAEQFSQAKRVIANAMRLWEKAGRHFLHLTDLSPASHSSLFNSRRVADIDIFFAAFAHGDAENFDGKGGLVAHSAYPPLGLVHFDASELWVLDGKGGGAGGTSGSQMKLHPLDLRYVALHEIGHALGLRHSSFRNSVMNRYYNQRGEQPEMSRGAPQLSKDDREAIEELFGEKCRKSFGGFS